MVKPGELIIPKSPLDISAQLIEKENEEARAGIKAHAQKLKEVRNGIINLLIEKDCTWGDWGMVIDLMNEASKSFMPKITIKEMTKNYATTQNLSRGEAQ